MRKGLISKSKQSILKNSTLPTFYLFLIGMTFIISCSPIKDDMYNSVTEIDIDFYCPCTLQRDSTEELKRTGITKDKVLIFSCVDEDTNDKYSYQRLFSKSSVYSDKQIIHAIDSTLRLNNIKHRELKIKGNNGLLISYPFARELEIYGKKSNYYIIIQGTDSLDEKMEKCIESINIVYSL